MYPFCQMFFQPTFKTLFWSRLFVSDWKTRLLETKHWYQVDLRKTGLFCNSVLTLICRCLWSNSVRFLGTAFSSVGPLICNFLEQNGLVRPQCLWKEAETHTRAEGRGSQLPSSSFILQNVLEVQSRGLNCCGDRAPVHAVGGPCV